MKGHIIKYTILLFLHLYTLTILLTTTGLAYLRKCKWAHLSYCAYIVSPQNEWK